MVMMVRDGKIISNSINQGKHEQKNCSALFVMKLFDVSTGDAKVSMRVNSSGVTASQNYKNDNEKDKFQGCRIREETSSPTDNMRQPENSNN